MEVDLAPGSLASQLEKEEKNDGKPMAHEKEAHVVVPQCCLTKMCHLFCPSKLKEKL